MQHDLEYLKAELFSLKQKWRPVELDSTKKITELLKWLAENVGDYYNYKDDGHVLFSGENWRILYTENSIEGYYESSFLLELDQEHDSTAYLLRWI
jgi:hypothetical protein